MIKSLAENLTRACLYSRLAGILPKILTIAKSTSESIVDTMGKLSRLTIHHPFEMMGRVAIL